MTTEAAPPATAAAEVLAAVGRVRRTVRRRLRRDWPHAPLPQAQIELLVLLREQPGLRVQEAAAILGLAANTVSTLVGALDAAGLLERRPDPADRRAAALHLSTAAERRLGEWRDRRAALAGTALAGLTPADRAAIAAALPALHRLADALEEHR
jgi:DNA-binding MarR family transcriptional regulator